MNAAFAAADAEFGAANCAQFPITADTVISGATSLADRLCLVPMTP